MFIHNKPHIFTYYTPKKKSIKLFHNYLNLHHNNPNLNIQIIPISIIFNHTPKHKKNKINPPLHILNNIQKFFTILWLGHNNFIHFSPSISLHHITNKHNTNKTITQKLTHVTHIHFTHQHLTTINPHLPTHQNLFNKLLTSHTITKTIKNKAHNKKISHKKAQQNTITLIKKITTNFSYKIIHLTNHILNFT